MTVAVSPAQDVLERLYDIYETEIGKPIIVNFSIGSKVEVSEEFNDIDAARKFACGIKEQVKGAATVEQRNSKVIITPKD
jgi:hypothetical protein